MKIGTLIIGTLNMDYLPAYRLKLYRDFKALGSQDVYGIIRFYEKNEAAITRLDTEEYFDCTLTYTEALFEASEFEKHIVMCDYLLAFVIQENITHWGGEDLYTRLLNKKAAAHFCQQNWEKACHVIQELIKMNPENKRLARFLRLCMIKNRPSWLSNVRAASVVIILFAAVVIAFELFVIKPFFPDLYYQALWTHNGMLAAGALTLAGGEMIHIWKAYESVKEFRKNAIRRKTSRETR